MIKIQHLQKSSSTEKDTMKELAAAVFKLGQIDGRINTLENVINSTINLTTNFDVYQKNVLNDISSLEAELNNIF